MLRRMLPALAVLTFCSISHAVTINPGLDVSVETTVGSAGTAKTGYFLTKSSGFEHSCIARPDGAPLGHAEKILIDLGKKAKIDITASKDADVINAEGLKKYDLVVFFTSGDLTTESKDGGKPMPASGVADLIEWVKQGGAFMGFHCATDSFHEKGEGTNPYIDMICAEFDGHGPQFAGTLTPTKPIHPVMKSIPAEGWTITEEWYTFKKYNKSAIHIAGLLNSGETGKTEPKYASDIPIVWVSKLGKGRVYYNAMGHREDVWTNEIFQAAVVDALNWTTGAGKTAAKPNFDKVMPAAAPAPAPAEAKN